MLLLPVGRDVTAGGGAEGRESWLVVSSGGAGQAGHHPAFPPLGGLLKVTATVFTQTQNIEIYLKSNFLSFHTSNFHT